MKIFNLTNQKGLFEEDIPNNTVRQGSRLGGGWGGLPLPKKNIRNKNCFCEIFTDVF